MALCPVGTIVIFFLPFIFRLVILPEPIVRKVCLAHEARFNWGTKPDSGFLSGRLPKLSPVEVYVIHQMHSADIFSIRQPVWLRRSPLLCNLYTK
jgi:hypothetical protein